MKYFIVGLIFLILLFNCQRNTSSKLTGEHDKGMHKVVISEVIQTLNYTYMRVKENNTEEWLAVPGINAKAGDTFYYDKGFHMTDFESKELQRKFHSITFLEQLNPEPDSSKKPSSIVSPGSSKAGIKKININIPPEAGSISISELYEHKETYSGKWVSVKGQVTKFSPEIMGKNWIHLQDGSEFNGSFDLTVTTDIKLKPGDTVTFRGRIILNKDLGYGYFYDILMENAILK